MKNLFALILVGSMFFAGCAQKEVVNDQAGIEEAPVAAPIVSEEPPMIEPPVAVVEEEVAPVPRAADKIFFEFNSHALTPASKEALAGNTLWLESQPELRIIIEGHADERGSDKYNLTLGEKRAKVTRDFLVSQGIAPERITTVSYGEKKATHGATSETVWAQDRQAVFVTSN